MLGLCRDMMEYTGIGLDMLGNSCMLGYVGLSWDMLRYVRICEIYLRYFGICWDMAALLYTHVRLLICSLFCQCKIKIDVM